MPPLTELYPFLTARIYKHFAPNGAFYRLFRRPFSSSGGPATQAEVSFDLDYRGNDVRGTGKAED